MALEILPLQLHLTLLLCFTHYIEHILTKIYSINFFKYYFILDSCISSSNVERIYHYFYNDYFNHNFQKKI